MSENYSGRLACDGYGNLLADEGERAGDPVAYSDGSFVFLNPGDKSHNEQYHERYADIEGTNDESAGSPENPTTGQAHHWGVTPDDLHYSEGAPRNTKLRFDADRLAARVTSHTEAYKNG